ncbi:POTRA domain-containing protein [Winogradskyella pelagia]|uniref:POTRA domain-containing protein n=1 Tax=Winogradskyella pelagia TaxID=2819984 RepID=UPI0032657DB4
MLRTLTLILFIGLANLCSSQNIWLNVTAEDETKTKLIDSIGYKEQFDSYSELESEINATVKRLWRKGFIDTYINSILKQNDTLFEAKLTLGMKRGRIRIKYDSTFNTKLLKLVTVEPNQDFFDLNLEDVETILNELNSKIAEQGDPFSSLQLINIRKENETYISADLKIISNQKRRIDNIVIKGYEKFPKSYIKHFFKLKSNQQFNLNEIKEKIELLEDLRFAEKIKDPEVLFTTDSTTLYLYIEKNRTNNFDGFLGFGTNEETNKLDFDGYLDLRLINNLNYGETLNLFYKSDEIDQQTFRVDLDLPYIFSSPVGIEAGLNIFRKDTTFVNANQYAKVNYLIDSQQKIGAGISFTNSSNLLENNTNELNDYTSNFFTVSYSFIKPQFYDPLFPINFLADINIGTGKRENNVESLSQNMARLDTYKIFNLNERNSVFLRLNGAFLISDNYFDNELFRFGGINSIRGFEENSLVANLYSVINTEYRYRLSSSVYIHSVFDAAYFENQLTQAKEKLFGFGFGFGLLTNAGLFRLNYSSGKSENRPFRLSDSKVHISLTATF